MKHLLTALVLTLLTACSDQSSTPDTHNEPNNNQATHNATPAIIPHPLSYTTGPATLHLSGEVKIVAEASATTSQAALLSLLDDLALTPTDRAETEITLKKINEPSLGPEGYYLDINSHISLSANTDTGLFYAVQTLRQLLPAEAAHSYTLGQLTIMDSPTYPWRGNMLDVARSFLPLDYLKAHIDRMALFKLNRLHLHLSDDQGWRVEIKQYPRLTEIGGASAVDGGRTGFYTQQQLKELVAYAEARHITIVPEIDLPGHTQAMIAAYNELACDDVTNLDVYTGTEVGFSKLCLTKPEAIYPVVTDVLTEIANIFPSPWLHIGGDEIEDPLYGEFIEKAALIVMSLGRTTVAWEEASVANTDNSMLLQLWNDEYDIEPALKRGHNIILSPCSYTYFDHGNYAGQPNTYDWCRKEGVPLERAYSLQPEKYRQAVGVESAMWSELVHTDATADNRLWPRLAATAEVAWSVPENRNYEDFLLRLKALIGQLQKLDIDYYEGPEVAD